MAERLQQRLESDVISENALVSAREQAEDQQHAYHTLLKCCSSASSLTSVATTLWSALVRRLRINSGLFTSPLRYCSSASSLMSSATMLCAALEVRRRIRRTLVKLAEMLQQRLTPDVISENALVSAREKAEDQQQVYQILLKCCSSASSLTSLATTLWSALSRRIVPW